MSSEESTDSIPITDSPYHPQELDMLAKTGLVVATFMAGAAVMVYELLAIRILQRHYGGAIDVWASEIAVCLGGLALGYYVGGRLADRYHSLRLMSAALFVSGLLGLFIERLALFAGNGLLEVDFAIAWHPLLAAGFSTFWPIVALGTVMPQAIRLKAHRLDGVGAAAGWIATISTAGSILGILVTAMVLLRHFGVLEILYGASILLMVVAALVGSLGLKGVAATALLLSLIPVQAHGQLLYETYSAYHHILVRDVGDTRMLLFDDDRQSLMSRSNPYAGGFEYADYFHVPFMLDPTIDRVLFIGLGGATGPKAYFRNYPRMKIEVAEIDPMVTRIARQYFGLPNDPRLRIHEMDGRAFLRRARGTFGAIMMDAYGSGPKGAFLPYHMATQEFFALARSKLVNGGCMFYNAVGELGGMNDNVIRHLMVTLESVFQAVYAFKANTSINTVFIAMKIDPDELQENGTRDGKGWPEGPWLAHPLGPAEFRALALKMPPGFRQLVAGIEQRVTQFSPVYSARRTGIVLTDDFAPVDVAPQRR